MAMNAGGRGIRLRPLEIGDVLDETFQVYKRNFVPLITTMGVVVIPTTVLSLPIAILAGVDEQTMARFFENPANLGAVIGGVAVIFLLAIVANLAQLIAAGAAVRIASDGILGRPTSVREAYSDAFGRFWSLLLVSFCVGIPIALLVITCVGIPVAVYLGLGWSLVFQAIILEGHGTFDAMRRSSDLVSGHRWRLLACLVLIGLIVWLLISIPNRAVLIRGQHRDGGQRQHDRPSVDADRERTLSGGRADPVRRHRARHRDAALLRPPRSEGGVRLAAAPARTSRSCSRQATSRTASRHRNTPSSRSSHRRHGAIRRIPSSNRHSTRPRCRRLRGRRRAHHRPDARH